MNLSKHKDFFDPLTQLQGNVHIIGCGAIGSTVAETLTRMGIPKLHLWDFDIVSPHNLANQMFRFKDINVPKVLAISSICHEINPDIELTGHSKGWAPDAPLSGYIFLCVDDIDLRRKIATENKPNRTIKFMADFRMRLTDAQHYAADWSNPEEQEKFLGTMQFSHEEAKAATPVNACGTTLNIIPTVRLITALGTANFVNFAKGEPHKTMIIADAFSGIVDAF